MSRLPNRPALAAVCAVLFLTFLDTTIVSVTLGSVQTELHAGVVSLQWVVNAYTLVFASLMLMAGSLGDRWGHRRVMLCGIAVFCIGSLVAARAPDPGTLIAGRAVMGVGASAAEPGTLAIIRQLFPGGAERARAIGVWAAVSGLALAMGPVFGGLLVGAWSWPAVFWFNVAAGLLLLVVVRRWVPESTGRLTGRLDVPGFILGFAFLFCVVFAAISGEESGYDAPGVLTLFVVGGICLLALLFVEHRTPSPMLDIRYLRAPMVRSALVVAFAVYFGIFSIFFFTALYLQEVVGYSAWRTAAVFGPMAVAIIAAALLTGIWVGWTRARIPMITGCLVSAAGILLTRNLLGDQPRFAPLALTLSVAGLGFGMAVVPLTAAVIGFMPADHAGIAAAVTNTMRQVGAVVGVAALGGLVNAHLTTGLTGRLNELDVPTGFQALVISAIEQGQVPSGGDAAAAAAYGPIVNKVIHATYAAFREGLSQALLVSAVLMVGAAGFTAITTRGTRSVSVTEE
jgi:EmrB/QacA subfamily drug resistance transporter